MSSKTVRSSNGAALSSRNKLLNKTNFKTSGLIANRLIKLKSSIYKKNIHGTINSKKSNILARITKKQLIKRFNIKVDYLEFRNLMSLTSSLSNKPFKLFIAYYINNVRLIDNF